ncbi:DNA polymerase III, beta subunit [Oleidesulfovibrio alaskensis G20]|jgi:DNA polymerase-3 subunit beta|uniref:Beta sliding clamp n=1 Tax=Oleidesulfovibrio alaskensis (strain ATCC BAA-1058 / DSM 17464 / G20) TaxID=207559 RepID=Q317S3_OLEA2|nr:DNA polymerase III subunit beta [Oleidesulfovibrio alaskensis]ABB36803.1 DNA polymerase III, beta subunit [Oleidesulfovibrio alaskensis G20]MBG0774741.1 DNA polymerase III subunit beta [Oleidesulfovibrio alaskensis]MBL3583457.1 DNA polymerase III subunit beta [Oleidesulfovibrio alaskensis]
MYLKVFKEDVIDGLQKAANIIPAKTGAAYLRSIWLKAEAGMVHVLSTDSNIEFRGSYKAEVTEEGLAGVQGRAFVDLIRKLPAGEITLHLDPKTGTLGIEQGRRKYTLPTNDTAWFQNFSDYPESGSVFWSGDFLQELIDKLSFCISDEDTMEAIACMSMKPRQDNAIEACGLNGHQFAMQRFLNDDIHALLPAEGILVQKKYLMELKKWLGADEIELNIDNKRLFFRTGDKRETFSLPLSYYQYPDYTSFVSKLSTPDAGALEVNRKDMMAALDRVLIFNTDNNRCTYFDLEAGEVSLSSQGQEVGSASESLEGTYDGSLKRIAFPTRNLIEIMNHYQSDSMRFTLTGTEGPCGLTGENDPDYLVIVMPMKIVEETYYSEEEV